MGSAFARCLSGFCCKVIAYDKYKFNFGTEFVEEVSLECLKEDSDIISLHTPLTSETSYILNRSFFTSCKKDIYIINTVVSSKIILTTN